MLSYTNMKKIIRFLTEVKQEFRNITWPKKDTLIQLTFVVIFISSIVAILLGSLDYVFTKSIAWLTSIK